MPCVLNKETFIVSRLIGVATDCNLIAQAHFKSPKGTVLALGHADATQQSGNTVVVETGSPFCK